MSIEKKWLLLFLLLWPLFSCKATDPGSPSESDTTQPNGSYVAVDGIEAEEDQAFANDFVWDYVYDNGTQKDTNAPDLTPPKDVQDTQPTQGAPICSQCQDESDCGGPKDYCLLNQTNGETFCSQECNAGNCPAGFECYLIADGILQCVPTSGTCQPTTPGCTPACSSVETCVNGQCIQQGCTPACSAGQTCSNGQCIDAGGWEEELQYCVDLINQHRSEHGRSALQRSASLEACAADGAEEDAGTGNPHGHFSRTQGCGYTSDAENEIPGWPLGGYGSVRNVITEGTQMMMNEGPGGGHYENILGTHTAVGCGIFVTSGNEVWVVQDFL